MNDLSTFAGPSIDWLSISPVLALLAGALFLAFGRFTDWRVAETLVFVDGCDYFDGGDWFVDRAVD